MMDVLRTGINTPNVSYLITKTVPNLNHIYCILMSNNNVLKFENTPLYTSL